MKKTFLFYLIFTSIALDASLISCLSSQVIVSSKVTVTFTPTEYLSFTPTIAVTPAWSGNYDDEIGTVSVAQTRASNFPLICNNHYPEQYSPSGLWLVELCASKDDHDLIMTLSNRETQVLWKLLYHDYIPAQDFADGGMLVVHWSKDGRYAYFTSHLGGSVGECFYDGWDTGSGLFRLDLQKGQTKATLPLINNLVWYGFSISPTDRRLVYGIRSLDLKILDLSTGQSINVGHEKDFSQGGWYVWSSDGLGFVYSTVTSKPDYGREGYSLRIVDARSGNEQILLESTEDCFDAVSWTEENILTVERYDRNYDRTLIEFDLKSNNIISETTPTP